MSTSAVKCVSNVLHRFFMLEISAFTEISVSNPQMKKWAKIKILKNLTVKTFKKVHFAQFEFFRGGGQKSKNLTIKRVRKHPKMEPSNGRKSKQNSRRYLSGAEGPPPQKKWISVKCLRIHYNAHFTNNQNKIEEQSLQNEWNACLPKIGNNPRNFWKTSDKNHHKRVKSKPNEHTRTLLALLW